MASKIYHNVYQPWTGTDGALTVSGGATPSKTSEWLDVSGWTDKKIAWEVDSGGTIDFNVTIDVSSQGAYELNNKTVTTDDYVTETVVDADTTAVYKYRDASDLDALQRPIRALRVTIDNDQAAEAVTGVQLWVEGWS